MVAFGNPCIGLITPKGVPRPAGSFGVTSTFADHVASGRAPGIDIGNGGCGAGVLAMSSGVISLIVPGKVGSTASIDSSIVRIRRSDGWEVGVAHLKIGAGFALNQQIVEGVQIGTVDKIGATACHVHMGAKDPSGVEVDAWPLLKQNGAVEDDVLQGANPVLIVNRGAAVKGDNTRFRSSPFVRPDNIVAEFDTGAAVVPDWKVEGTAVLVGGVTSKSWYGFWANVGAGKQFVYASELVLTPPAPIEQSGHSDADLIKAVQTAGHNAAVDVSAAAATAATKYPKP